MLFFIIRRFVTMIPLLLGISVLVFVLMAIAPGDFLDVARTQEDIPAEYIERMEEEFALGEPWHTRYFIWLGNVVQGNLGESWIYRVPVTELLWQRIPATLVLSALSIMFALCVAIPMGVLAAIYKDSIFDRISSMFAYAALSIPEFFLALLAVMFAAQTGWFPTGGLSSVEHEFMSFWGRMADYAHHLVLPTIVLGMGSVASYMRIMRANFLDYIRSDFVTTARAKGLGEGRVMFVHVLRNAINPLVSASGFILATLLSGSILVENVMNYPGLGQLIFEALMRQDEFVVVAAVMMGCVMLMLGNLIADLLLAWSDPRIRLEKN
ncbi:ABC transporter permease [Desulfonatronospira sp.]|uniref:ABC transporter permease n=1 Tax=Desulfonatronospira sp. TaxID=1962951 RepID=UPI0025B7AABC|nr:ABC transporter permease [Desulfonatronospira sp.]